MAFRTEVSNMYDAVERFFKICILLVLYDAFILYISIYFIVH